MTISRMTEQLKSAAFLELVNTVPPKLAAIPRSSIDQV
jgi:hypothetical protein